MQFLVLFVPFLDVLVLVRIPDSDDARSRERKFAILGRTGVEVSWTEKSLSVATVGASGGSGPQPAATSAATTPTTPTNRYQRALCANTTPASRNPSRHARAERHPAGSGEARSVIAGGDAGPNTSEVRRTQLAVTKIENRL